MSAVWTTEVGTAEAQRRREGMLGVPPSGGYALADQEASGITGRRLRAMRGRQAGLTTAGLPTSLCLCASAVKKTLRCLPLFLLPLLLWGVAQSAPAPDAPSVVLVVGAAGDEEYGTDFVQQADLWGRACEAAGAPLTRIGLDPGDDSPDRERLKSHLASEPADSARPLWLVLIGHGTWDDREARFNLRGPDFSAAELNEWLQPLRRPLAVINTASSSAPFLKALAGTNRVVIAATRSGVEQNVTRFGLPFVKALQDPAADLDRDGQVSLLEAFLLASRHVGEFYETAGRLATEHALLEDTGDGLGTPADWFRGLRATKRAKDGAQLDGTLAQAWVLVRSPQEQALSPEVRIRRDQIERELEALRDRKASMGSDAYYRNLETLLLELARLYESPKSADNPLRVP